MHPHKESRSVMGCLSWSLLMLLCNRYWPYIRICMCLYMCTMSIGHTYVSVCVCTCVPRLLAIHTYLYVFVHVYHVYWPYIRICMCLYMCTTSIGHTYVSVCVCTCVPCLLAIHTHTMSILGHTRQEHCCYLFVKCGARNWDVTSDVDV